MANGFGPTIENAKKQQEYIDSLKQQFGEMTPVDQSLREKSVNIATDVIGALPFGGGGDYYDRKIAKNLFGDYYADNIADSIGVLDFTPLGLVYAVDEALREYGQAEKATDYILPTVGLGLSALEALPLTEIGTRPLRRFLSNLANKTSAPTDISRRTLLKGAVAAPVLKKAKNIKNILRLTDLPQMKKSLIKFEAEGLGIELSDLSDEFGREIKSFDDLNSKEIDKVFEDNFLDPATPDSDSFEDDMRQQIQEALDDFQLSSKSFVEGTEKLTTDQKFSSPMGELLENFTEEMKKSGYSNKEISDVLDNSLDDLFNRGTSLDELDDEMM